MFDKTKRAILASLPRANNGEVSTNETRNAIHKKLEEEATRQKQEKQAKKQAKQKEKKRDKDLTKKELRARVAELENDAAERKNDVAELRNDVAELKNHGHHGTHLPYNDSAETYNMPSMSGALWTNKKNKDNDERSDISRDRKEQLTPMSVEDGVAFGTELFNADYPGAEVTQDWPLSPRKLQQVLDDVRRNPPRKTGSNLDLTTFTSTNNIPDEADGDILPPHPEAHQQELPNRTRGKSAVPSKGLKSKMSMDIFSRSKKPGSELTSAHPITISGPVGPVTHTGYANAVGRATNFTIPSPAESLKNTASASNDPDRIETLKAHSGNAQGVFSPTTTTVDAAHMHERITQLQSLAKDKNDRLERLQSETTTTKNGDKSRPLTKSKSMFFNAKQAVVRKFSSTAEKDAEKNAQDDNTLVETDPYIPETPKSRINLRVAEGTNLGSSKVQALTGNGRIKRKPVNTSHSTD